ncbi:MAG: hypothetical protein KGM17_10795 [Sphingomonadales bacterium]|nr:hypothetical protein [Sphingomonadales bacterium]
MAIHSGVSDPMLRGHRLFFIAAIGWATLSAAAQHDNGQRQKTQNHAQQHEQHAPPLTIKPAIGTRSSASNDGNCKGAYDESKTCDAIAANAAVDQSRYAYWQAVEAGLGLLVGAGTLIAAFIAAKWAKKAAQETEIGARAAIDAAVSSRDSLHASRAWICFSEHTSDIIGSAFVDGVRYNGAMIKIHWMNVGNSPAIQAGLKVQWFKVKTGEPCPTFDPIMDDTAPRTLVIGPGQKFAGMPIPILGSDYDGFIKGKFEYFIYSTAEYRDIFTNIVRKSEVCARFSVQGQKADGGNATPNIVMQPEGLNNTAT